MLHSKGLHSEPASYQFKLVPVKMAARRGDDRPFGSGQTLDLVCTDSCAFPGNPTLL